MARRLRDLEDAGLVVRRRYSKRPARSEYHLSELGREASEVLLLMHFGDRHLSAQVPVVWAHGAPDHDEHALDPVLVCRGCGRPAGDGLHDPSAPGAPATATTAPQHVAQGAGEGAGEGE